MLSQIHITLLEKRESVCDWVSECRCVYASEGVQGGHSKTIFLDSNQAEPVDPNFLGQEPSLDYKESFEPKSSFLDQVVQKLRASIGLTYSPFLGSFIDI